MHIGSSDMKIGLWMEEKNIWLMQLIWRFERETLKGERECLCVYIHIRKEVEARLQEGAGHPWPWRSTGPNPFHTFWLLLPLPNTTQSHCSHFPSHRSTINNFLGSSNFLPLSYTKWNPLTNNKPHLFLFLLLFESINRYKY